MLMSSQYPEHNMTIHIHTYYQECLRNTESYSEVIVKKQKPQIGGSARLDTCGREYKTVSQRQGGGKLTTPARQASLLR